jgi:hypothetical protein
LKRGPATHFPKTVRRLALAVAGWLATSAFAFEPSSSLSDHLEFPTDELPEFSGAASTLSPLVPEPLDFGTDVLNALAADSLGPLTDPNVDGMPPLGDPEMELLEVPEEAEDRMWRLRPYLKTGVTYDDNIFITNTNRTADIIYNVAAGFAFQLGDYRGLQNNYLLLEYLAEGFFFTDHPAQNSLDQALNLLAQYRINQAALQFESIFRSLDGADRQVGTFTSRLLFFNALRLVYQYSEKTDLDFEANQRTNYYPQQLSSYTWETRAAFDYQILPKTKIGLQAVLGLNQVEDSPDRWYQTLNARAAYDLTGKLTVKSSVGIQFNQYVGGGEPMRILPVFALGAEYELTPKTLFKLTAYRNMQASPSLEGQDYIATGGEAGIRQQFAENLSFGLAAGYENDTYVANTTAVKASRVDNFYFFRPSLSYSFLKYLNATLAYEYRANSSNFQSDTWLDNRVNFELSLDL